MNTPATEDPATAALTLLGSHATEYPTNPDEAKLECIPNAFAGKGNYSVTLTCPEFTAVCPKTGQPDFATIVISYMPRDLLIESKALKLYLFAFRNVGMFHEFVVNKIAHDLFAAMNPHTLTITGQFMPRGGISICPTVTLPSTEELLREAREASERMDRQVRTSPTDLLPTPPELRTDS